VSETPEITSDRGTVEATADGARVVFRRSYPDPIEDVWSAVTEPERLQRWIGTWTGTPRVGGTVDFRMTAEGEDAPAEAVTILACDPPRTLDVQWTLPDQPVWRVELRLEEADGATGGTVLTFVHHLAGDPAAFGDIGPGWQYYLDRLGAALTDSAMPAWDGYLEQLGDHYRAGPAQA
jgi:uncharacterized protein YndB with AHSA1/START domain